MNDDARALVARLARTVVSAVRSMQAPDDLPPKTGPRQDAHMPEKPKEVQVTLNSHADWDKQAAVVQIENTKTGACRHVNVPLEKDERITSILLGPVAGVSGKVSLGEG